jgi:hypothetical protein
MGHPTKFFFFGCVLVAFCSFAKPYTYVHNIWFVEHKM